MLKEGIYEQVINEDISKKLRDINLDKYILEKEDIDVEEAKTIISNYTSEVIKKALRYIRESSKDSDREAILSQIKAANDLIKKLANITGEDSLLEYEISEEGQLLTSLYSKIKEKKVRPVTPLSQSSLFTGSHKEPNMLGEINKEILSADEVDLLISFVKWSGLRCLMDSFREFTEDDNHKLRIITTTYMGATDYKAVEELGKLKNTEVKISYDVERTRLHAKAYLFKRETRFTTAYIGSSNISSSALTSGLEWNIKVTEKDSFDIIKKIEATFESYWNDSEFVSFNGENDESKNRLKESLNKENRKDDNSLIYNFDIKPYYYQKEILEKLRAERELFHRNKNLIVVATGVGKTVIAAFDYKDFRKVNKRNNLLFIAHREEILKQSLGTFRAILRDNNFGDIWVGGHTSSDISHLFMSIQSFNSSKLYEKCETDYYDYIIIDEFHHAEANSYQRLLDYYNPKILLGLTATPERMDGKNVLERFDDRIAAELRLPEAIDRKLLSPFQYFAVTDSVDLSAIKWTRGGYDIKQLEKVYNNNDLRVNQIVKSIYKYVTDIDSVTGLGFCVSIEHAKYMAASFNKRGIPSLALYGESSSEDRNTAKSRLINGEIKFIFSVDIYNEGVDIKEANTVLFLRPTESLTIFLQQLGRGLRLCDGKECLTVLDYVGQAHKDYNFEDKFKALIGKSSHSVEYNIENGFLNLPKGCYIQLEKQAKEYILRNIKSVKLNKINLIGKIKYFEKDNGIKLTLSNFLNHYNYSLSDFYGKNGDRSFNSMKVEAGIIDDFKDENEKNITKKLKNLFHINSKRFLTFFIKLFDNIDEYRDGDFRGEENLLLSMVYYTFYTDNPAKVGFKSYLEGLGKLFNERNMKEEVLEILKYKYETMDFITEDCNLGFVCPLELHCNYSRDQILAALDGYNEETSPSLQAGVKYFKEKKLDAFFITLNKSEKDFSPSTLYEDYAINETLFHWQSQSRTSDDSETGRRYINHKRTGNKIILFVREYRVEEGYPAPYVYLGEALYESHSGSMPISFVWRLKKEIPAKLMREANKGIV